MIDLKREVPNTCHGDPGTVFAEHLRPPYGWRPGHDNRAYGGVEPWRTCSYCGSMHPLDLLGFIERDEIQLDSSDWKYGWPHKFYAHVKNPHAGKPSTSGGIGCGAGSADRYTLEQIQKQHPGYVNWRANEHRGWEADAAPSPAPAKMHGKFYNEHLVDLNDEEFAALASRMLVRTGIDFVRVGGKLKFRRAA